ncbi:MAG: right-handed parallel beta-helix repeat-containing protein [Bacteroidota bacterium]
MKNLISYTSLLFVLFFLGASDLSYAQTPVDELTSGRGGIILIDEPGHYFLRDTLWVTTTNSDGIIINSDNVTLDLNGFAIIAGTPASDNGIFVDGSHSNITIKNGTVSGFGEDGIHGLNADQSTFQHLLLKNNGDEGLTADFNCLITNCTATGNGTEGFDVDDGTIIRNCTASHNGAEGIQSSEGCIIAYCTSFKNGGDGISVAAGGKVEGCTVYDNTLFGLDIALGVLCINNVVYRNGWHGIDVFNSGLVLYNVSNNNGQCITNGTCGIGTNGQGENTSQGAGIRTFANARIMYNQCDGNYFGIVAAGSDGTFISNSTQHNRHAGIFGRISGSLYLKNTAEGNGFAQSPSTSDLAIYPLGDIVFSPLAYPGSSIGPVIDVSNAGDISTLSGASHPFSNFTY